MITSPWPFIYNPIEKMKEQLVQALELCLLPNDLSIQEGRNILELAKSHPGFLKEMILILADSNVIEILLD